MDQRQLFKLLCGTAEGDQQAFRELYQHTSPILFAVALKIVQSRETAEQALQEAYQKIWHNAAEYHRCKGSVLTWMIGVLRYRALDLTRPDSEADSSSLAAKQPAPPQFQNSGRVNTAEQVRLEQCLDELDHDQRQAIITAYANGTTHHELAVILITTPVVVKQRLRQGLETLRRCLSR